MTRPVPPRGANRRPVYLDNQATTPVDPRVLAKMLPYFTEAFGNPHSTSHVYGREAEQAVEAARAEVAVLIGAEPREIVFTSGATESNNLALKGALRFPGTRRRRIVTLASEHKCVLESCRQLESEGVEVARLPVGGDGLVDLGLLGRALAEGATVVSIMAAHNEVGVIQPLADIGALARQAGVLFHTDAAQAVGKIALDVEAMKIDLLSISGHKLYGPKGIGALYVRRRPRVRLQPMIDGGGQERGLRSGTLAPPLVVGLGEACARAGAEMVDEAARLLALRSRFLSGVSQRLDGVGVNGTMHHRLPGNLNLSFAGATALGIIETCPGLALSTGSACTSALVEPSYVLRAMGVPDDVAGSSIRIGFGRFTTVDEVDFAVDTLVAAVTRLRAGLAGPSPGLESVLAGAK